MEYLLSSLIGYLLGSFPTAYIFLQKTKGLDITKEGSGNVGAMNSFEVSNSKFVGISVLFIDLLKGGASVLIPILVFGNVFIYPAIGLLFAVFSHCYNPWIFFKGGRGLATAAGGAAIIFPYLLAVWVIFWVLFYVMRKDILLANIAATILSVLVLFGTYRIAFNYAFPKPAGVDILLTASSSILIIIFIKHIEPLKELIQKQKNKRKHKNE
ncbi:MAG: glycerol-3-phosphate acyltransferase [Ignavibacteriota bacterium]|nr:glycerol-3-phosphate acyltransferase [Ignavibacteriales bacterium]MBL1123553.1 glycerol-3-phosphate acyltransferase [Ignavibacteriota bacterium]MCC7094124.1 glycerol-3-phosphate acyltransferase [Ignavibacteriaceae bacterium]MCE7856991.1 glycerol-3-phosphate acyltransferase [Ignavibacteria bacterium CHB3]MEB2296714.1 glycerol-3-phosphate acyltransferase [Ignavibacteria bacterium]